MADQVPEWMEGIELSDDLRNSPVLLDTPDIQTMAKRLVDNHAQVGRSIRLPGENATDEDRATFNQQLMEKVPGLMFTPDLNDPEAMAQLYRRLGHPEQADGYKAPEIDTQGIELDKAPAEAFAKIAHKAGLSQNQFATIVKAVAEENVQVSLMGKQKQQEEMEGLKGEWGTNFDSRMQQIKNLATQTKAPQLLQDALNNGGAGADTLRWLHEVIKVVGSEGTQLVNQGTEQEPGLDALEAQARADEIYRQLQEMPPSDPRRQALMMKRVEYIRIASGKK